jgi:foldase protein PrsA
MANNDVSDVHQATTGYFIVRMKNNNSTERYDTEVANAKTKAENAEFDKIYEKVKSTHKFKLNDKSIKKLKMGNLTIIEKQQ